MGLKVGSSCWERSRNPHTHTQTEALLSLCWPSRPMGIKGLFPFLSENAPLAIKETKLEAMTGRTLAIDASMCLYQFIVAVRLGEGQSNLTNEAGEVTSHIQGFLTRTIRLLEAGIKPVFVFDGKPPELKRGTLAERQEQKRAADSDLEAALACDRERWRALKEAEKELRDLRAYEVGLPRKHRKVVNGALEAVCEMRRLAEPRALAKERLVMRRVVRLDNSTTTAGGERRENQSP